MYFFWWTFALIVKFVFSEFVPVFPDEAYYWVWSLHPQLSYFDHPPLVSYLYILSGDWTGPFIRWPFVLLGHLTLLLWDSILKRHHFSLFQRLIWLGGAMITPVIGIGSILGTPDVPLLFFWTLSLWLFLLAIERPSLFLYLTLGLSLGFGFLSKYHIVLFVPSALIYLLANRRLYKVRWDYFPALVFAGLIASSPVIWWNYLHNWSSFRFQLLHGLGGGDYQAYWTISYVLGVLTIAFPTVLYWAGRGWRFQLSAFAWTPLGFFLLSSLKNVVEANWAIMAYPVLIAMGAYRGLTWKTLKIPLSFWATLLVLVSTNIQNPWIPVNIEKLREPFILQDLAASLKYEVMPIYTENYQQASALWFWLRRPVYKMPDSGRVDFLDQISPGELPKSQFLLVLNAESGEPSWVTRLGYQAKKQTPGQRYSVWKVSPIR